MIRKFMRVAGVLTALSLLSSPVFGQTVTENATNAGSMNHSSGMAMSEGMVKVADTVVVGDLELSGGYTRAMPPRSISGGGFVTITNNGSYADRLVSASSPVAEHVETHIMIMDGEVMKMSSRPDGFIIEAGETIELKPGGKHLMFINVSERFVEGGEVMVTLNFERAGTTHLVLPVAKIGMVMGMNNGAMEHGSMNQGSMDHSTMGSDNKSD